MSIRAPVSNPRALELAGRNVPDPERQSADDAHDQRRRNQDEEERRPEVRPSTAAVVREPTLAAAHVRQHRRPVETAPESPQPLLGTAAAAPGARLPGRPPLFLAPVVLLEQGSA